MRYEQMEITVPGQVTGAAKLTAYLLDRISVAEKKRRPAVIVCPGGGYHFCSDREAEPVVMQYLGMGYHGFRLDYSTEPNRFPAALLELAKTVAMIREHAGEWHVDTEKIYVCGFSAGGHLACSLGVFWNREFVWKPLGLTPETIRPNGLILCYPVITSGEFRHDGSFKNLLGDAVTQEQMEPVSLEEQVSGDMPEAFIWHTFEDKGVPVENSLLLASAMRKQGVKFELHIYPDGGHGSSLANEETSGTLHPELIITACQSWIKLVHTWIEGKP